MGMPKAQSSAGDLEPTCKRYRPLVPRPITTAQAFNVKRFIRPESGPRKTGFPAQQKQECSQAEPSRWNPTVEQVGILETLYGSGMRTPTMSQVEQITAELGKYGGVQGKNVFYWFQNHKARERKMQKRISLLLGYTSTPPSQSNCASTPYEQFGDGVREGEEDGDRTLMLFPLHPDGIKEGI